MLYNITIFQKGGLILWKKDFDHLSGDPVSGLIRDILLKEKQNQNSYNSRDNTYVLQWTQDNVRNLYFVSVVPKGFPAPYVPTLLERVQAKFVNTFPDNNPFQDCSSFDNIFTKIYTKTINENAQKTKVPKTFEETEKGKNVKKRETKKDKKKKEKEEEERKAEEERLAQEAQKNENSTETNAKLEQLKNLAGRGRRSGRVMRQGPKGGNKTKTR